MRRNLWWRVLLAVVGLTYVVWTVTAGNSGVKAPSAQTSSPSTSQSAPDARETLNGFPAQVGETLELINQGGPYPYSRDDSVFMNREGRLPTQPRGYWREYTVPTPGSSDRGARRIVRGVAGETYYTGDHYRTFTRIDRSSR